MPLTQNQLDAIKILLDGTEENNRGVQKLLSELTKSRDNISSLVNIHEDITDANATIILGKIKTNTKNTAQELVNLLE